MSKQSLQKDKWVGLGVAGFGGLFALSIPFQVSAVSESGNYLVSGRTLPVIVAAILILLGGLLALQSHMACKKCATVELPSVPAGEQRQRNKRVAVYITAIALYMFSMSYISYELASALMLLFTMTYTGCTSKFTRVLTAILVPALIYLIFCKGMYMAMPDSLVLDFIREL